MGTAPLTHSRDVSQHKVQLVLAAAWEAITRLKSVGCAAGHPPCNNSMMNDERNGEKAKGESLLPDPRGEGFPSDCPPEIDARIIANLLHDSGLRRKPVGMSEKSRVSSASGPRLPAGDHRYGMDRKTRTVGAGFNLQTGPEPGRIAQ